MQQLSRATEYKEGPPGRGASDHHSTIASHFSMLYTRSAQLYYVLEQSFAHSDPRTGRSNELAARWYRLLCGESRGHSLDILAQQAFFVAFSEIPEASQTQMSYEQRSVHNLRLITEVTRDWLLAAVTYHMSVGEPLNEDGRVSGLQILEYTASDLQDFKSGHYRSGDWPRPRRVAAGSWNTSTVELFRAGEEGTTCVADEKIHDELHNIPPPLTRYVFDDLHDLRPNMWAQHPPSVYDNGQYANSPIRNWAAQVSARESSSGQSPAAESTWSGTTPSTTWSPPATGADQEMEVEQARQSENQEEPSTTFETAQAPQLPVLEDVLSDPTLRFPDLLRDSSRRHHW